MTDQLFGVKPWDPIMLTSAVLLLALAALLASLIPARRAAGVAQVALEERIVSEIRRCCAEFERLLPRIWQELWHPTYLN